MARIPDGSNWQVSSQPTPGEANRQAAMVRAVSLYSEKKLLLLEERFEE